MSIPYTISPGKSVSLFLNGRYKTVPASSANYKALVAALSQDVKDIDLICELADISTFIAKKTFGAVQISDDKVRWNGQDVHGVIVDRILQHLKLGLELTPLANFLDRLMGNPTIDVRDDMFAWLESGNAPITPDGKFLAFKAVRSDYKDKHTGKMDNSVGQIVSMPREQVDAIRTNECSRGLHFCSHDYLRTFYGNGDRVVVVQIDPADVVAIPTDYNRQKGRAWRYEVIGEIDYDKAPTFYAGSPVVEVVVSNNEPEAEPEQKHEWKVGDKFYFIGDTGDYDDISSNTAYKVIAVSGSDVTFIDDAGDAQCLPFSDIESEERSAETKTSFNSGDKVERQFYSPTAGRSYLQSEIIALVEAHGQNGMSRLTGVPRTTVQDWVKIINKD
jgi:hypothetical protein